MWSELTQIKYAFMKFHTPREINLILTADSSKLSSADYESLNLSSINYKSLAYHCADGVPPALRALYCTWKDAGLIEELPQSGSLEYLIKQGVCLLNRNKANAAELKDTRELIYKLQELKPIIVIDDIGDLRGPNVLPNCADSFRVINDMLHSYGYKKINFDPRPEIEREFKANARTVVVFTDGSCYPNKKTSEARGGYAVKFAIGPLSDTCLYGSITNNPYATNQRAEARAIYMTMQYADLRGDEWDKLIICTDSQFWISMFMAFMPKWSAEKFATMQNPDLTKPMYNLYKKIRRGKIIEFRHIPAHDSAKWSHEPVNSYKRFCYMQNDHVDRQANWARVHCDIGQDVTEINGEPIDI